MAWDDTYGESVEQLRKWPLQQFYRQAVRLKTSRNKTQQGT
jgi:hypothetical protein